MIISQFSYITRVLTHPLTKGLMGKKLIVYIRGIIYICIASDINSPPYIRSFDKVTIRKATYPDIRQIMPVIDAAKGIMRASGNFGQWVNGYPSEAAIASDIDKGNGYVLVDQGTVVGYFAFIASPEPTYSYIEGGEWLEPSLPYYVIHRIASFPEVHGVFKAIMDFAFSVCPNIRIDTHRDNHIMQHNIIKYGFRYCGIIYLESGDDRLAYQRIQAD